MNNFSAFYNKYKDRLLAYLIRLTGDYHLSNDIVQESFTRYLEHYGCTEKSPSLLFAIARNALFDIMRNAQRRARFEETQQNPVKNPEDQLIKRDEYRQILSAWEKLGPSERDILGLVINGQLSYREIANITGFSEANVKVKIHRARVKLKQNKGDDNAGRA